MNAQHPNADLVALLKPGTPTPAPLHFTEQLETSGQAIYVVSATDEDGQRFHDVRFLPPISDWQTARNYAHLFACAPELLRHRAALLAACKAGLAICPPREELGAQATAVLDLLLNALAIAEGRTAQLGAPSTPEGEQP